MPKVARRSRRSNRGHHWKFPEESGSSRTVTKSAGEPCSLSLALEAFAKEEEEEENLKTAGASPSTDQRISSDGGVGDLQAKRKHKQQPEKDDSDSDPDDPSVQRTRNQKRRLIDVGDLADSYVSPDQLLELTRPYVDKKAAAAAASDMFICTQCGYRRRERAAVMQHVAVQHMNVWTIKCLMCGQLERVAGRMESHLNTCHQLTREMDKVGDPSTGYRLVTSAQSTVDILPESFRLFLLLQVVTFTVR